MQGMNAHTGKWLIGSEHLAQSIKRLFNTRKRSLFGRRSVHGALNDLLERGATEENMAYFANEIAEALDRFEPRAELKRACLKAVKAPDATLIQLDVWDLENNQALRLEIN